MTSAPLVEEHRDGLEFVSRLKKGIASKLPADRLRQYVLWYWTNHIRPHFFQEEKILLPWLPAGHALIGKVKEEHHYIRELILTIDEEADYRTLALLADLVRDHILFEEADVYPFLMNNIEPLTGQRIDEMLRKHALPASDWKDRFWDEDLS